jgi:hypothetical protein
MFKARAYPSEPPLLGRLLALPTKIRLGQKGLPGTKALVYQAHSHILSQKTLNIDHQGPMLFNFYGHTLQMDLLS